jgi:spore coat polysaccharide biosynthesis protein SpsF (cytidylyltransferase family)
VAAQTLAAQRPASPGATWLRGQLRRIPSDGGCSGERAEAAQMRVGGASKAVASVQVRMGSSRLPGKAMLPVAGRPLLGHLLKRLSRSQQLHEVIVATTTKAEDDIIADYCLTVGTRVYRGSSDDVIGRMLGALHLTDATIGVEVYGDSPIIDPAIVDDLIGQFMACSDDCDFLGNDIKTTYPPGMIVEVFKIPALEDADRRAQDLAIREHGTLFIRRHPELYRLVNIEAPEEHRRPELEMEVDSKEDVAVIDAIVAHFKGRDDFSLTEIIAFLDAHPEVSSLNANVPRRWKAFRA